MIIKRVLPLLLVMTFSVHAGIEMTKHNLSTTGPGAIKSATETEICIFCHIPHHEREGTPLWNRKMPTVNYTLYNSEFIQRMNYPAPEQLSTTEGQPGIVSRQCLSCHDGTVAIGAVYIVRGTELGDQIISVENTTTSGTLPNNLRTFIGTNLSLHHPVAVEYNPNVQKTFEDGSVKTIELRTPHPTPPIKLYTYGGKSYVECTSCHDPHKQNKQFLRVDVGNLAQDFNQTCVSCHDKTGWFSSAHSTITDQFYDDTGVNTHYGEGSQVSVADLGCGNCHIVHNRPPYPPTGKPLLRKPEEQTCFKGASGNADLAPCHGTGGTKNIYAVLPDSKLYGHPVRDISDIHTILDVLYGYGSGETDPAGAHTIKFSDSKHAECADCHNPHSAQVGNHAEPADTNTGWYPQSPDEYTNDVSGALMNVYGVEPTWSGLWTQPNTFTTKAAAQKEYQICLKCHSYWALGATTTGDCRVDIVSDQRPGEKLTDQACEFNPNNRSAHPVIMPLSSMPGRYAGNPVGLKSPWDTNVGNQTMYCSDCHGADNEVGGDPRGPHGSNHKFVLKGPNTDWPEADNQLLRLSDIGSKDIFCKNCHNLSAVRAHYIRPHTNIDPACVDCHIAIPHGSPVSKLLGYDTFPAPYNYGGNSLKIRKYKWNSGMNRWGVYSVVSPCSDCHWNDLTDYDTVPTYGP